LTKTIVLDTNVLLSNPAILGDLDGADIVIPDTVLSELDKLKTARVDPDLRFKGRDVSRRLFELSERGNLSEGVELDGAGSLRVVPFDRVSQMPEELSARSADDRILAVAHQLASEAEDDDELVLMTADLNMLLKAQSLGLSVDRYKAEDEEGFAKRYISRPFQRYRVPLTILAIALAVFGGILWVASIARTGSVGGGVPVEFTDQLNTQQQQILTYLLALQENPSWGNPQTRAPIYAIDAIKHYQSVVKAHPEDLDARSDLAAMYFYSGQTDLGIAETLAVLKVDPTKVQPNFNLGLMYWQGRRNFKDAASQFVKVIDLTNNGDLTAQGINAVARQNLAQVVRDAAAAGTKITPSIPATPTTIPHTNGTTGSTSTGGAN
jgi:hypothetical protein